MQQSSWKRCWCSALCLAGFGLAAGVQADAVGVVQVLRQGGCGGLLPAAPPLRHSAALDRAAKAWAEGWTPTAAVERSGYPAERTANLHITAPDSGVTQVLRRSSCRTLMDAKLRDMGSFYRGSDTWLVMASPDVVPEPEQAPQLVARALQLVNEVRARGARCGQRSFAPAPPVKLSGTLAGVALGHAVDMAQHNYFEHEDLAGRTPAARVRAVGYAEKLVGENIAYGPKTAEEVVRGWLESPGHCENIMDPRFSEMGIAFAAGQVSRRGLYWVQLLVAPKA